MREGMYERRGWIYELVLAFISPFFLLAILIALELVFKPVNSPLYISLIWSVTALGAVVVSSILLFYACKTWRVAARGIHWLEVQSLLPCANMIAAAGFLTVHTLFLAVGLNSIGISPPPEVEENYMRTLFSRTALLEGQYILLVVGIVTYIMHRKIRHELALAIEEDGKQKQES